MDLAVWIDDAWKDYQETWAMVDEGLHDLYHRHGHERFEDVYTKVAVVNRVYMAGITRVVGGKGYGGRGGGEWRTHRLFGKQSTVAKPRAPKWDFTVERLKQRFQVA